MQQNLVAAISEMRLHEKILRFMFPAYQPGSGDRRVDLARRAMWPDSEKVDELEDISDRVRRQQPEVDSLLEVTKIQYEDFLTRGKILDNLVEEIKRGNE